MLKGNFKYITKTDCWNIPIVTEYFLAVVVKTATLVSTILAYTNILFEKHGSRPKTMKVNWSLKLLNIIDQTNPCFHVSLFSP